MKYLSVCSGIEAATMAWHGLGWTPIGFSEIEPFPAAVLAHHYPDVPNYGDMTKFQEWPDADVDVLVGGTPCQSFSVAGLRKGMADPRGNLALTYLAVADRYRPDWLVWENVPGVLSSNGGRDFGAFLGGLGQLGYGFAYRVLDAQYVRTCEFPRAVPQRRRRVFVVGHLGDWRRAAAVLFDGESLRGNPPPRRKAGEGIARGFECGPQGGGITDVAPTLDTRCKDGQIRNQLGAGVIAHDVAGTMKACKDSGGWSNSADHAAAGYMVAQPVAPILNAHFGDKMGLENQHINQGGVCSSPPVAFDCKGTEVQFTDDGSHPTLRSMGHNASHQNAGGHAAVAIQERAVAFDLNQITSKTNRSQPDPEVHHTLPATSTPPHLAEPVAFDMRGREGGAMPEGPHDTANIRAADGGSSRSYVAAPWAVRRLTPAECEALQGFPRDFTRIPYRNKPADKCPDGPRYKALGNSMAVNVMQWIGQRIDMVSKIETEQDQ